MDLIGVEVDKSGGSNASEIKNERQEIEQQQATQQNTYHQHDQKMNLTRDKGKRITP